MICIYRIIIFLDYTRVIGKYFSTAIFFYYIRVIGKYFNTMVKKKNCDSRIEPPNFLTVFRLTLNREVGD